MVRAKPFWKSKTFWVNVLGFIAVLATSLKDYLTTEQAVSLLAIINVVLRVYTKQPVKFK